MYYIILQVLVMASLCRGENSAQQYPQVYAISSQSYKREDVPLSYKHSYVHVYTTRRPVAAHEPHHKVFKGESGKYGSLQYAPLIDSSAMFSKLSPSLSASGNINEFSVTSKRAHLEPRTVKPEENTKMLPVSLGHKHPHSHPHPWPRPANMEYIPGHNIEVMQSANRMPGHNAIYRSYAEVSPHDKYNKIGYSRQFLIYQSPQRKQELESFKPYSSTSTPTTEPTTEALTTTTKNENTFRNYVYNAGKKKNYKKADTTAHKPPYTKMHALLLNVARTYNFAQPPPPLPAADPLIMGQAQYIIPDNPNQNLLKMNSKIHIVPALNNRPFSFL